MTVVQMTPAQEIRLGLLKTVGNDAGAFTEANKFVGDDVLKFELFRECYSVTYNENTPVSKTITAIAEAKQRYDLITAQ
ncbi:MAG: DUF2560 family protein [Plesiomonas shigelloides]